MTTRTNYRATHLGVQLAASIAAAGITLALLATLRPGELPERTLRWAGVRSTALPQRAAVPGPLLSPRLAAAVPAGEARR
jgi:hypothetical protein